MSSCAAIQFSFIITRVRCTLRRKQSTHVSAVASDGNDLPIDREARFDDAFNKSIFVLRR